LRRQVPRARCPSAAITDWLSAINLETAVVSVEWD